MVLKESFYSSREARFFAYVVVILTVAGVLGCFSRPGNVIHDPFPPPPQPIMGWSTWYAFGPKISDSLVRQEADAMVASGMRDAGYEYVNLDDGWQGERDPQGNLHPDASFPDMRALADYLHSRGLKLGVYTSIGAKSCTGRPGSLGHYDQDALTFLGWGVDMVKLDKCYLQSSEQNDWLVVAQFSATIRGHETHSVILNTGLVEGQPWLWAVPHAVNMWRYTLDAQDTFGNMLQIADLDAPLFPYARPRAWNDPDMLQVGHHGMTSIEYQTHMTLWAMLAAPLVASTDLLQITPAALATLMNPDVIAINQDPLVNQAQRILTGSYDVWLKTQLDGWALAVINRTTQPLTYTVDPTMLGIAATQAHEVWTNKTVTLPYSGTVVGHGCALFKIS
jgi:alpha-galactosidase